MRLCHSLRDYLSFFRLVLPIHSFSIVRDLVMLTSTLWENVPSLVNIIYVLSWKRKITFWQLFFFLIWLPVYLCQELGLLLKSSIDRGQLVPDHVMSRLIFTDLRAIEQSSWLLDGKKARHSHAFRANLQIFLHAAVNLSLHEWHA